MQELPRFSPGAAPPPRRFDFFFDRLALCLRKGRGFSLFQADPACVADFARACEQRGLAPFTIHLSSVQTGAGEIPASPGFVVLVQDLPYPDFLARAAVIADRIVFPLWFRRVPVCFFSWLAREAYETPPVTGQDLHRDVSRVTRALLAEQAFRLLERSNIPLASPGALEPGGQVRLFTPLEEKMQAALEAHQLGYQPGVRLGRETVDFLVSVGGRQVAVECESRASYEPAPPLAGYPVCRFSAGEIEADVEKCIGVLQAAVDYPARPAYGLDGDLDASQQAAVMSVSGPVRVLAPAGSGKTKTLVNRVLHLLNQGIAPERILALAFNKKAREEMQDRLERRGARSTQGVDVRTFHSFGYEIVREGLGWTFGGPAQKKTARALVKSALQEHTELPALRNQDPLDAFLAGLRRAKRELPVLASVTVEYGEKLYPLEPVFHSYLKGQASARFLDFDDMIYLAVRLLLEDPALRRRVQSRFEFVLVDEFQDLNEAQLLLLQIIGLPENNIFAVGDDDQMIYGFRGADVKHIVEFEKRFPVASTHVLNTNYRSSRMIVRHTGWLIGHNRDRVRKDIQARREAQPGRFEVAGGASLLEQAKLAAEWLAAHKKQNNLHWREYAVLYRYNAYQFPAAVMLDALGIPHTPAATGPLFASPVGMDIHSYLQVILFPQEAKAADFERILKRPNKYLSNARIVQAADWDSFLRLRQLPGLREWERRALTDFVTRVEDFAQVAGLRGISAAGFLQTLKSEFGLEEFYRGQSRRSDDLDQASDEALLDVITALAGSYRTPLEFFRFLSQSMGEQADDPETETGEREEPGGDEVHLSTIHRAKGREFRNVVYFHLSQSTADPQQPVFVEEERRVVYVGATRPKDDLLITFSSARPSEFLREIALHPAYRDLQDDDLQRDRRTAQLRLERARVVLKQLEAGRQRQIAAFRALTRAAPARQPAWLRSLLDRLQLWRTARALGRIESAEGQIRAQQQGTIAALEGEVQALEEEAKMRAALLARPQPHEHETIYRRVIEAVSRNDGTGLDQLLAEDLIDHTPLPDQSPGRDGFKEWMASARASFPDLHGTVEDVIVAGNDYVIGRVTWHGTQAGAFAGLPPTHAPAALTAIHIARLKERKIVEWWGAADLLAAVRQLGGRVVPGDRERPG